MWPICVEGTRFSPRKIGIFYGFVCVSGARPKRLRRPISANSPLSKLSNELSSVQIGSVVWAGHFVKIPTIAPLGHGAPFLSRPTNYKLTGPPFIFHSCRQPSSGRSTRLSGGRYGTAFSLFPLYFNPSARPLQFLPPPDRVLAGSVYYSAYSAY